MTIDEEKFKQNVQNAHKELAKINYGKLHKALLELEDEAKKEEFKQNPRAFIEKRGISMPADARAYIDEGQIKAPIIPPPEPEDEIDITICIRFCWPGGIGLVIGINFGD